MPGCWLVGGAVRDVLLGMPSVDLDVVVEGALVRATPRTGRPSARRRACVAHERFATATVAAPELTFDLVGARRERYPRPGALPEVEPASLEEDLVRRDFTSTPLAASL